MEKLAGDWLGGYSMKLWRNAAGLLIPSKGTYPLSFLHSSYSGPEIWACSKGSIRKLNILGARKQVNGLAQTSSWPGCCCSQKTIFQAVLLVAPGSRTSYLIATNSASSLK